MAFVPNSCRDGPIAAGTGFPSGPSVPMTLDLTLLGGFEARVIETDALLRLPTRKCEAALAYTCMHPRQAVRRDLLISLLWADVPRSQGRHSLRQTLTRLRRAFTPCVGREALVTVSDAIHVVEARVRVDALEFERGVAESDSAALDRACDLYRGRFLDGFTIPEEPFDGWVVNERTRLHQLAIDAFMRRFDLFEQAGDVRRAIPAAIRLLELEPLQEEVHRRLMVLYRASGQVSSALNQYDMYARRLKHELGAQPSPAMTALFTEMLHGSSPADLAIAALPVAVTAVRATS